MSKKEQCREAFEASLLDLGYALTNRERNIAEDFWRAAWTTRATLSETETVAEPADSPCATGGGE